MKAFWIRNSNKNNPKHKDNKTSHDIKITKCKECGELKITGVAIKPPAINLGKITGTEYRLPINKTIWKKQLKKQ